MITGHKGFIGSLLNKRLSDHFGIDFKEGKNLISCELPKGVDTIYHLAAWTSVEESWSLPYIYQMDLVVIARLVKEYPNAKIIYAQSAASLEVNSPYGFSKWVCGEYLKKFHKNYVICTFPNVYGGGKGVVDIFKNKEEVTIYGDGEQIRDFVHVDDIIEGLVLAENWSVGEYCMGSGKGTKVKDLAIGKTIIWADARNEIRESILPNTTPDWSPKTDIMEYMK